MEEESAGAIRVIVLGTVELIFLDVETDKGSSFWAKKDSSAGKTGSAVSDAFDLGTGQFDPSLKRLNNFVVEDDFFVLS